MQQGLLKNSQRLVVFIISFVLTVIPHIGISVIVECHVAQIKGKGGVCLQGK
jgi:hypothetical protein